MTNLGVHLVGGLITAEEGEGVILGEREEVLAVGVEWISHRQEAVRDQKQQVLTRPVAGRLEAERDRRNNSTFVVVYDLGDDYIGLITGMHFWYSG